jgi:hypothetical protein
MLNPAPGDYCRLAQSEQPRLVVVIDTEEEFDWSSSFSSKNTSVRAMRCIHRIQNMFEEFHITPVYVIDYPVASQSDGYLPLREIHDDKRCLIGAHLHPWVNPPFDEVVTRHNSYPGNLSRTLEAKKLRILGDEIEKQFGARPVIYKAGRYGIGPATADILEEQGYEVDLSVCPRMDYSFDGGPNFLENSAQPYWFGNRRKLLELPLTVGFAGRLRRWGAGLHGLASRPSLARLHPVGLLARLNLVDKIWLSPEGYRSSEHIKLTRDFYADGLRVFSFAFHSPSVEPGHTPYVRSQNDLSSFLDRCRRFFDFFLGELGGCPSTPLELRRLLTAPQS